jgi:hypothetical protein
MNDDFIRSLQADWRSQQSDVDKILRRLHRNRWTPHAVLGAEILACAVAFLVGLWFAWVAATGGQHKLLFALSAGVMLVTAPALCVASVMARRSSLEWDVETPESLLKVAIRRAESSLRAIKIGRWHIAIIAAFVTTLWIAEAGGLIDAIDFLIFYSSTCLAACVAGGLWMHWRSIRLERERAASLRLLAALQVDEGSN